MKLRKNTLVVFTSDNGPAITGIHPHGSPGPLRDKKGSIYDGGIRVPGMVQWPGHVKPGTSDVPIGGVDVLPTLCAVAGIRPPRDRKLDGTNILPLLIGQSVSRKQPLHWQFHRSRSLVNVAIRSGDWKLCARMTTPRPRPSGGIPPNEMKLIKTAELTRFELYNLKQDIGERKNLSKSNPAVFAALKKQLIALHHDVRNEGPTWPTWKWPRYESQRIIWPKYFRRRK